MIISYYRRLILKELSSFLPYFDGGIIISANRGSESLISDLTKEPLKRVDRVDEEWDFRSSDESKVLLLDGVFNFEEDPQALFEKAFARLNRSSRVVLIAYNSYLQFFYRIANFLGLRKGPLPINFLTQIHLENLAKLTGFEISKRRYVALFPFNLWGISSLINCLGPVLPIIRNFTLASIYVFRPIKPSIDCAVSVVVPARNEKGHIAMALERLRPLAQYLERRENLEVIFVEGHSTDDTWGEILKQKEVFEQEFDIKYLQQPGKGKNDAVRVGFAAATKELLVIQDADLTAEPEMLVRFVKAYSDGLGDFINGNRLMLPMQKEAMQFLNFYGNLFFAKALRHILQLPIGDSLCGTKLLSRRDYQRICEWRKNFGDFDPFGDFELLFGASVLGLGAVDLPVAYKARAYGTTNISRFRHGWMLLKMTFIGLVRVKTGRI